MAAAGWDCCPFCGQVIKLRGPGFDETPCPGCGRTLWFIAGRSAAWFFTSAAELDQILFFLEEKGWLSKLGLDSLDVVELTMELEERLSEK